MPILSDEVISELNELIYAWLDAGADTPFTISEDLAERIRRDLEAETRA